MRVRKSGHMDFGKKVKLLSKKNLFMHIIFYLVPKPLPMSVFIHDTNEQVKYKSTIVNASLSKAIDTWNNPVLHDKYCDFIKTEDTPFLRTPKVDLKEKRFVLCLFEIV